MAFRAQPYGLIGNNTASIRNLKQRASQSRRTHLTDNIRSRVPYTLSGNSAGPVFKASPWESPGFLSMADERSNDGGEKKDAMEREYLKWKKWPGARSMWNWMKRRPRVSFGLASVAWVYVLYSGVLSAPFVYDDIDQIANNPALQSWHDVYSRFILSPVSLTSRFLGSSNSTYRPLFWTSLAVDRHLWGTDASGFHFTNLFLHWLNGFLLFQLLRKLELLALCRGARRAGVAGFACQQRGYRVDQRSRLSVEHGIHTSCSSGWFGIRAQTPSLALADRLHCVRYHGKL